MQEILVYFAINVTAAILMDIIKRFQLASLVCITNVGVMSFLFEPLGIDCKPSFNTARNVAFLYHTD